MKENSSNQNCGQAGFTLVEVMVALTVFAIGLLALSLMQSRSISGNAGANRLTSASTWAADRVERIFAMDYDDPLLDDRTGDGDGPTEDANNDGVDDDDDANNDGIKDPDDTDNDNDGILNTNDSEDDSEFGLHHATVATADGNETSPDLSYTIFWNIAIDVPMIDSKTINVIVNRQEGQLIRAVTFKYIKAREI